MALGAPPEIAGASQGASQGPQGQAPAAQPQRPSSPVDLRGPLRQRAALFVFPLLRTSGSLAARGCLEGLGFREPRIAQPGPSQPQGQRGASGHMAARAPLRASPAARRPSFEAFPPSGQSERL